MPDATSVKVMAKSALAVQTLTRSAERPQPCNGQAAAADITATPLVAAVLSGSDNVVFRIILPPRYYAVGLEQKVGIL